MKAPAQKAPIQSHKHIAKSGIDLIDERTAAFERCLSLDSREHDCTSSRKDPRMALPSG